MTLISEQILDLSWHDAWMHEARAADGRWVKGVGSELTHEAYGHGTVTAVKGRAATVRFDDGSVRQFGSLMEHEPVGEAKYFQTHIGPTDGDVPDPTDTEHGHLAPEIPSVDHPWGPGGGWEAMDQHMIPYTTRGNAAIEAALRRGEQPAKPMDVDAVDKVIAKRHLTQDTTLYRGVGLSPELRAKLVPGATFTDKAYTSTSTAPQWADEFADFRITGTAPWMNGEMKAEPHPDWEPARMVLHARKGQEIGPGEPGLAEYVLPRDSNFRVTGIGRGADGMTEIYTDVLPVTQHTALTPVDYPDPRDRWLKQRKITPDGRVIYENSNVELGWRYNPLEKRNAHGEWTRGAGDVLSAVAKGANEYKAPPADRVNVAGLKGSENPFVKKYGLSSKNIVASYDAATPDEIEQGKRWYSDAHDVATAIGKGDADKGAAMLSAFSVQTDWATDVMNAASTMANGKVPEHGVGITGSVRARAQAILDAKTHEDIDKLFPKAGSAKTRNFYHLMLNGGDRPGDTEGHVVIDRHALSVAAGRRLTSQETVAPTYAEMAKEHPDWTHEQAQAYRATFPDDPTSSIYSYQHIADMYRAAALEISKRDGTSISPHQLQAITWLHQLHANDAEDNRLMELAAEAVSHGGKMSSVPGAINAKGRASAMSHRWTAWASYAKAHQIPVHSGTTALANTISGQVRDFAAWEHELRDSKGRWTRFGGVGEAVKVMEKEREGFSVSPRTGESPTSGYMVALEGHTHRYPASILDDPDKLHRALDDMLMSERESFQGSDMYLGGWVEDGKLWLDPSQNVQDRAEAERLGRERDQVGIFDLNTFNTIDTGGSGGGRIIDHANQGPREGAGQLLGPAGGRAAGGRGATGRRHQGGIAAQVVALGWHDAWRHELRGYHGKWVKSGEAVAAEGFSRPQVWNAVNWLWQDAQKGHRTLEAKALEDAQNHLSLGQDNTAADDLMRAAAAASVLPGGRSRAEQYTGLAQGLHPGAQDPDRAAIGKYMESVDQSVPKLLGGSKTHLDWDHKPPSIYPDKDHPDYLAYIDWDGHVNFSQSTADAIKQGTTSTGTINNPDGFLVSLHEFIHAALPPGQKRATNGDMQAYQKPAGQAIEEGFTELAATHHAEEFFNAAGIGKRPTPYLDPDGGNDPEAVAQVNRYALLAEKKAAELEKDGRPQYAKAARDLREFGSSLRADPWNIATEDFSSGFSGALGEVQHLGDSSLSEWAMRMRSEGQHIQDTPLSRHVTMAEYARKMADPKRITGGDSWGHYRTWTKNAYDWTAEIARKLGSENDPTVIRKLADQVSQVGTAAKVRVLAEQLLVANGIHDLTSEAKARALDSAEKQIMASWGKYAAKDVASMASSSMLRAVTAMGYRTVAA